MIRKLVIFCRDVRDWLVELHDAWENEAVRLQGTDLTSLVSRITIRAVLGDFTPRYVHLSALLTLF